jgi:ABC-type nitrate/sulfonate/bicarbonate transport system substrate-binding protein
MRKKLTTGLWSALAMVWLAASVPAEAADPVTIRLGTGPAAEEHMWLLFVKPDMFKNAGKLYKLDAIPFPAADKSVQALEAGAIDFGSWSANASISAASEGVKFKLIASLSKESSKAFSTTFMSLADSGIKNVKDLKGKTVGINGFSTAGHVWVRAALEGAGMTESDIKLVPIRFPAMAEALSAKKIDVGMFPQPFAAMAEQQMKLQKVFSAVDAVPFDQELVVISAKEEFLKKNAAAVTGFLEDLRQATKFFLEKPKEARQLLIDAKLVRVPPDLFLTMNDYYRDPNLTVDAAALSKMQDLQVKAGFQKNKADIKALVDNSYIPK